VQLKHLETEDWMFRSFSAVVSLKKSKGLAVITKDLHERQSICAIDARGNLNEKFEAHGQ
jgi:hypothetical protein